MKTYTAFAGDAWLATGSRDEIAATLRAMPDMPASALLLFDDEDGRQIDLDLREPPAPETPPPAARRGRPSLGVVAREVTLLPRHWDWLGEQPGGASAALRRLVDAARKAEGDGHGRRNAAYRFLTAIAGDRPHYEEAIRSLFADDRAGFEGHAARWPIAIRDHAIGLAWGETLR
ncbi:DUF2239 family protein [Sphingomonas abietis]|uniref:DUF2239 family protein n=1 Tax=Sphingomonas abietis TaxID=3012344 RepID=A0ABY7NPZ9_9SPHN|nr:DUF2239 family protein [Sphingomonas abietis]WBO23030.1 DUF2239 family protein [Sphingomonas abietis]